MYMGIILVVLFMCVAVWLTLNLIQDKILPLMAENVNENIYEDRPQFKVKKSLPMVGLFGTKFKDIQLYDIERNERGEIDTNSDLYKVVANKLINELEISSKQEGFEFSNAFVELGDKNSSRYKSYIYLMRCLTNVNFEAFVMKEGNTNFSSFNPEVLSEIENHVNSIIVEVGGFIINEIAKGMKGKV